MDRLRIAEDFAVWSRKELGSNLVRVVLFGSVARGDDQPGSDIDLVVEVNADPVAVRRLLGSRIMEIAAREGVFISAFVRSSAASSERSGAGIYRTLEKEGRVLA